MNDDSVTAVRVIFPEGVEIEGVKIITLKPNDVLVIKSDNISERHLSSMGQQLSKYLGFNLSIMRLPAQDDVSVITRGEDNEEKI